MREEDIPDCLSRRYQAIDQLIRELSSVLSYEPKSGDPGIRLMCNFWNILNEDSETNKPEVHNLRNQNKFGMDCDLFMAENDEEWPAGRDTTCGPPPPDRPDATCGPTPKTTTPPLNETLTSLKKAASFDRNCHIKMKKLQQAEQNLKEQIEALEKKEKDGVELMKQADAMWYDMENAYKEKIESSLGRQKDLVSELQEVEQSAAKWRKNKKELETELDSLNKCQLEIISKINDKCNDYKTVIADIECLKNKIEKSKAETEAAKQATMNMTHESDARMFKHTEKLKKMDGEMKELYKNKEAKEKEAKQYIKESREELQKLLKALIQKKIEREDVQSEKNGIIQEINLLKDTCNLCAERCKKKQIDLNLELNGIDNEIFEWTIKCEKCNELVDTDDVRKFCIDCPRCMARRECLINNDYTCNEDPHYDCVCLRVKRRFLDNVFENMYTVLSKRVTTDVGKSISSTILKCLKRSKNGKIDKKTRELIHDFILHVVKNKLNLTIIGGAVKTRCELDTKTYKQLMLCLKDVKLIPPNKSEKGTDPKKDPCGRWGGPNECNCPNGPENCICTKKAPPGPKELTTAPSEPPSEDPGDEVICPTKEQPCSFDCGAHSASRIGTEVAAYRPSPCKTGPCEITYGKNMRAAQCVLGPAALPRSRGMPWRLEPYYGKSDKRCGVTKANMATQPTHIPDKITLPRETIVENVKASQSKMLNIYNVSIDDYEKPKELTRETSAGDIVIKESHWNDDENKVKVDTDMNQQLKAKRSNKYVIYNVNKSETQSDSTEELVKAHSNRSLELSSTDSSISPTIDFDSRKSMKIYVKKNPAGKDLASIQEIKHKKNDCLSKYTKNEKQNNKILKHNIYDVVQKSIFETEKQPSKEKWRKSIVCEKKSKINDTNHTKNCKEIELYKNDLENIYYSNNQKIKIVIESANGVSNYVKADVVKTHSGNIAIRTNKLCDIGDISYKTKEYPVVIKRTQNGLYNVLIGDRDINSMNAVIRETRSAGSLIVISQAAVQSSLKNRHTNVIRNKLYRVKITGAKQDMQISQVALKQSPSLNYIVVINKEFEKQYYSILQSVDDNSLCFIKLRKAGSEITINFDEECDKNAILEKNTYNDIKIKTNFSALNLLKRSQTSLKNSKRFKNILDSLFLQSCNKYSKIEKKPCVVKNKSDSHLRAMLNITSFSKAASKILLTDSGHYTVVLDNMTDFIKNVTNQMAMSPECIKSVTNSDTGEITMIWNSNQSENGNPEYLKITPSGNFYAIIDNADKLNDIQNNSNIIKKDINTSEKISNGSAHLIRKNWRPDNKTTSISRRVSFERNSKIKVDEDNIIKSTYHPMYRNFKQDKGYKSVTKSKTYKTHQYHFTTRSRMRKKSVIIP